ncbi:MAG: putative Zn-dependent protease [Cocleimonas sp.]|jgi:predicted Zn-dependent protease
MFLHPAHDILSKDNQNGTITILRPPIIMQKLNLFPILLFSLFLMIPSANAELNLELPDLNLPEIGGISGHYISAVKEAEQGLRILRSLRARGALIESPEVNLWIRSLGNRLTTRAPNTATPFHFAVAKDLSVNAFATLGGVVVINAGLILRSDSESELAAVMSHEIAHITQRHIQRIIADAEKNKFATGAALVVGALAATQDSQAGMAILNTTLAASAHQQLSFGRGAESEADRVGLRILASAGFNPQAMPSFLQKLEQYDDSNTADIREFLQNHPLSVKRVADTTTRAKRYGIFKGQENISYLYMREKVRVLTAASSPTPVSVSTKIQSYAKALKLKQRGAYAQAVQVSKIKNTRNISEAVLLAELHNKQKQFQQTLTLLNPLIKIYPGNEAITAPLAQAYASLGNIQQAWRVLRDVNVSEQTSLEIFEIKQEIARLMGNSSLAYRAVAERSIRTGRYKAAELQLRQAIRLPGSSLVGLREMQQMLSSMQSIKRVRN